MKKEICKLLKISEVSYYRWRKERKVFSLLEKYFTEEDLSEFLETGEITKQERLNELLEIEKKYNQILEITKSDHSIYNTFIADKDRGNTSKFAINNFFNSLSWCTQKNN